MDAVVLPAARALLLLTGVLVLYGPVAFLDTWTSAAAADRARAKRSLLFPFATVLKLLGKRAALPAGGDAILYFLGPLLATLPLLLLLAALPLGPALVTPSQTVFLATLVDQGDVLMALSMLALPTLAVVLSAWAGGNRLALLGGLRMALVRSGAVVVVALAALSVSRSAGTLNLSAVVLHQANRALGPLPALGVFSSPFGFACAAVAIGVLLQRMPRSRSDQQADLVEAYSSTAAGPVLLGHRVFEVLDVLALAALMVTLFFGGWTWPGLTDATTTSSLALALAAASFAGKTLLGVAALFLLRRALPPLRHDQAVRLLWTVLAPLAALALVVHISWLSSWFS